MKTKIFHTVNSGLYFWDGVTGIFIDGLHEDSAMGFSDTPDEIIFELKERRGVFQHLDAILFTHLHRDHFCPWMLKYAIQQIPELYVFGPEIPETNIATSFISRGIQSLRINRLHVYALDTIHDGKHFSDVKHKSMLIQFGEESFFIAGDAFFDTQRADIFFTNLFSKVSIAFINIYQALSSGCQDFLRLISPKRICLYHLPFEEDDGFGYRKLSLEASQRFPEDLPSLGRFPIK